MTAPTETLAPELVPLAPPSYRVACRVCGSTQMLSYLNLGRMPYANGLQRPDEPLASVAPLRVFACQICKLSQLSYVAPRETLYTDYKYRSGVSAGWRRHCASLATEFGGAGKTALDIASNDGTMVRAMAATGATAVGVEPSQSFADCAYNRVTGWWGRNFVEAQGMGRSADVITAQNVLGHVHDVHDFMAGVTSALKMRGIAIIEVPYVGALLESLAFDTVYHEHLSYWSVTALHKLCESHGLIVADVKMLHSIHGGSMRATLAVTGAVQSPNVAHYLNDEQRILRKSNYLRFSERVSGRMRDINDELRHAQPYAGYGAAAKTAVMLGCLDVRAYPEVVYDDNDGKHGYAIPGTRVPIAAPPTSWVGKDAPKRLCIFAWNYADDIIAKLRAAGYRGDIFVPMPMPRWDNA